MDQTPPQNESRQPSQPQVIIMEPPKPKKSGFLAKLFVSFLVSVFLGSLALNVLLFGTVVMLGLADADEDRVQEKYFALNKVGESKIAVITIEGTILSGEGFFKKQIDHAQKDIENGTLKAIVLRVNSPGGTIAGSDYMLHHLRELVGGDAPVDDAEKNSDRKSASKTRDAKKIPIVVSMGPIAASGGYYVSMCVGDTPKSIFAEPCTWTGSIGVIIPHYNLAGLMDKLGIQEDDIASHPLKTMGSMSRKMTPQEKEFFQELVNIGFTRFKDMIKYGRPAFRKNPAALDKLATGQIFTAKQAKEGGLIDEIGFIEQAIDRAVELAKLDKKNVKVVKYKAEPKLSNVLFGQSETRKSFDLSLLFDSTVPRAFYLCTWLPALAGSGK